MKKCSDCGLEKDSSEFYKEKRVKDGLKNQCKNCFLDYKKTKYVKKEIKSLKPRKDLTGQRFGMLLVLNFEVKKNGPNTCEGGWNCQCDCGKIAHVVTHRLTANQVRSCGCARSSKTGNKNHNWNGYEEISGSMYSKIMVGAARRGLDFKVDAKYLWELFIKQNRKCALTGLDLIIQSPSRRNKTINASLDRIDSSKGYIEGNLQWLHKDVNMMKNCFDQDYFIKVCKLVGNHAQTSTVPN